MKRILPLIAAAAIAASPALGGGHCLQQQFYSRPYYVAPAVKYVAPVAQKQAQVTVVNNLKLVGIPVPFSYSQPIAEQGQTITGYSAKASVYQDVSLPLLFDQSHRLAEQSLRLGQSGVAGFREMVELEAEAQRKEREINAAAAGITSILSQTRENRLRIQTSGVQTRVEARANVQGVPDVPQPPAETAAQVVNQYCVRCHGQEAPKAGFDITSPQLTAEQWLEVLDRVSSPDPERHMPPAGEPQLTVQERRLLFAYDPEATE